MKQEAQYSTTKDSGEREERKKRGMKLVWMNEWVSRLKDPLWAQHNEWQKALIKSSHSEILNPKDKEKTRKMGYLEKYQHQTDKGLLKNIAY